MPTISLTNVWIGSTTRVLPHTLCVSLLQTCGYFNFSQDAGLPTQMPKTTSLLVPLLVLWPGTRRGGTAKWQNSLCMCAQYKQIAKSESTIHKRMVLDFNTFSDRDLFALEKIVSIMDQCDAMFEFYDNIVMTTFDEYHSKSFHLAD